MRLISTLAAMLAAGSAAAASFDLPPRAPGQWEMRVQVDTAAMPPQIIRMCLDAETDKLINAKFGSMASGICSKQDQKAEGQTIVLDSECKVGDMAAVSHSVITGDFASAYMMKTDVRISGGNMTRGLAGAAQQQSVQQATTIDAKRVGDCTAGAKPGDIDLGDGRIVNIRDMQTPTIQ